MQPLPPQIRAERLVAVGRVVLAASSLFAVWLDPSEPVRNASIAYGLLVAYLVIAVGVALLWWGPEPLSSRRRLLTHGFDLLFFSLFIYFTSGPGSPFFAFFVFSLVCATLRWRWQGTLWTAAAAVAIFLAVGFYFAEVLHDATFQLHSFIIRGVYLAVVAVLLAYLGFHEHRAREVMSLLAAWPQRRADRQSQAQLGDDLRYACQVLGCSRAALLWVEPEEPWRHLAWWDGTELTWQRHAPEAEPVVLAPAVATASFFCQQLEREQPAVWCRTPERLLRVATRPLPTTPTSWSALRSVISCPLSGNTVEGRAFFFDRAEVTLDELTLAEVVAGVLADRLDHLHFAEALRLSAADEERVRLARDLHDGVLQSLTGIALRLVVAGRSIDDDPQATRRGIDELRELIALEQRDLRFFIEELRPAPGAVHRAGPELAARLTELSNRVEREWGLEVKLDIPEPAPPVRESLGRHVYHLVREAMVNAVRHGGASRVAVDLRSSEQHLSITVADNGAGFPVHGRFDQDSLAALGGGPRNIRERIAALCGQLELQSDASGARLTMTLPLEEAGR